MTQTNGETKLQKFHSVMQKVLKYGIVLALIAFIVLVLMNKDQFSEKVAKGTPEHKLTKIEVTDGDKVVQKFKQFHIRWNVGYHDRPKRTDRKSWKY